MVDVSDIHASNDVFAMEGTWPQLFSWCGPYPHPATTAICYGTLAYQIVVCSYTAKNCCVEICICLTAHVTVQVKIS